MNRKLHALEATSRLRHDRAHVALRRRQDAIRSVATRALFVAVTLATLIIPFLPWSSRADKRWAQSLLAMIVAWVVGYRLGKASRSRART
jgi:hypothetical protein